MKLPTSFKTILFILMLLGAQVSTAFVNSTVFSSSSETSCSMNMASHHASHDSSMSEMSDEMSTIEKTMNCCDNTDTTICCEGSCECSALSATSLFLGTQGLSQTLPLQSDVLSNAISPLHSAFSSLLIRPPIHS